MSAPGLFMWIFCIGLSVLGLAALLFPSRQRRQRREVLREPQRYVRRTHNSPNKWWAV